MRNAALLAAIWLMGCATPGVDLLVPRRLEECGPGRLERVDGLDAAIAIDTSSSTARPSGSDIDADGTTGELHHGIPTDPDDSMLASEVAAVYSLLALLPERDLRLAIVGFSGRREVAEQASVVVREREAVVHARLTSDPFALGEALRRVLRKGSRGNTDFAAAIRRSLRALPDDGRRRVVLMISDSPEPVLPIPSHPSYRALRPFDGSDPDLQPVARQAIRSRVVVHTIGLGEAADTDPPHTLSRLAGATGGSYTSVSDPARLHCALLDSLTPGKGNDAPRRRSADVGSFARLR
jgi:hypothetical protein